MRPGFGLLGAQGVARDGSHPLPCRRSRRSVPPMPSVGVLLMRWLRWQWVISTLVEDHLMIRADRGGQVTRGDQDSVDGWERTFPSTLSMLQRSSPAAIAYVLHSTADTLSHSRSPRSWLIDGRLMAAARLPLSIAAARRGAALFSLWLGRGGPSHVPTAALCSG